MDLNELDKNLQIMTMIIKKILTIPFLFILGAGSRVLYEYLQNKKMPTKREVLAIITLAMMSSVTTYLVMHAMGYDKKWIEVSVLVMAFIGHTGATWLMENWEKYLPFKKK